MESKITIFEKRDSESHREYAYRVLHDNIMTLKLVPGTTLIEQEIAELLKISRTPVHEAITKLSDESLVDIYPRRASIVSQIDVDILREGFFLRLSIEPIIMKQLSGTICHEERSRLLENLNQQKKIVESSRDANEFFTLDNEFHKLTYEMVEKPYSWKAIRSVNGHFDRVRYMDAIINHTDLFEIYHEHKWIYHTILTGMVSEHEIKEFYEKHLGKCWKNFFRLFETYPQYFKGDLGQL